jgi:hypothetical protein
VHCRLVRLFEVSSSKRSVGGMWVQEIAAGAFSQVSGLLIDSLDQVSGLLIDSLDQVSGLLA